MKTCILSESSADETAIRILAEAVHGAPLRHIDGPPVRARGWHSIFAALPVFIKHLYYHTDADAFIIVMDSDRSPPHEASHEGEGGSVDECRYCRLIHDIAYVRSQLGSMPKRGRFNIGVGLAVPAIEAWYLCGKEHGVSEANWISGQKAKKPPYARNQLKQMVYKTERPSIEMETKMGSEAAQRLAGDIKQLEERFPNGFGALARQIRSWSTK